MQLPNAITLSRLGVAVLSFVMLELAGRPEADSRLAIDAPLMWAAFGLFLVAAITDFVDGWLARRWKQVTPLGRVLDPFADKVLTCGAMILLLKFPEARKIMPDWVVVIVVAREFLVTAVRGVVEAAGRPFPADRLGKWKMVSQCWTAAALLTLDAGTDVFGWAAVAGLWISLVLTVVSGANYVWKARDVLFAR